MEAGVLVGLRVRTWKHSFSASLLRVASADLALRMRNELALELLDREGEHVIDDEPVVISNGSEVTRKTRGEGVPLPGWLVLTNRRLIYAALADKKRTAVDLAALRATHIEDGWMTLAWRDRRGGAQAISLGFKPRTKLLADVVSRISVDKVFHDAGAATPGRATRRDRLARAWSSVARRAAPE